MADHPRDATEAGAPDPADKVAANEFQSQKKRSKRNAARKS
jgi:hypothetical protein